MRLIHPAVDVEPDLDALYAYPRLPWLRVNMIGSVDGAAVVDGGSRKLGTATDRQLIGRLRGLSDAVLVGSATARGEGYGPLRPRRERREARAAAGLAPVPRLVIVSGSLDLDLGSPTFTEPELPTVVVTHGAADPERRRATAKVAEVIVAGDQVVDAAAAVDALVDRGLVRLLCEGGPTLLGALVAADRVDELCVTVSPMLVAGDAGRIVAGPPLPEPRDLTLAHTLEDDGYLYLRYVRAAQAPST